MTKDQLVVVATFDTGPEAHAARIHLEQEGLRATVTDDVAVTALWHVGTALGGVKLLVSDKDAQRASQLLANEDDDSPGEIPQTNWICPKCKSEVDAGFTVCWNCGAQFDKATVKQTGPAESVSVKVVHPPTDFTDEASDDEDSAGSQVESTWQCPFCAASVPSISETCQRCGRDRAGVPNPYFAGRARSESADDLLQDSDSEVEQTVLLAWRASVIGLFLCPGLLHLYSMVLLLKSADARVRLTPMGNRRFWGAWILNVLTGLVFGAGVLSLGSSAW